MGFLDKAKGLADQAMAKADQAMAGGPTTKSADPYFRDLGVELDFRPVLLSIIREPSTHPLAGGVMLLCYALYRKDPVFVLGQALGVVIYVRNLWLIQAHRAR